MNPFLDDPTPTTGAPYDEYYFPPGCICYYREDADWGDVRTAPRGGCPIHSCTCLAGAVGGAHATYCLTVALTQPNAAPTPEGVEV